MNFKRFHESKNLFDYKTAYAQYLSGDDVVITPVQMTAEKQYFTSAEVGKTITISVYAKTVTSTRVYIRANINGVNIDGNSVSSGDSGAITVTCTPKSTSDYFNLTYGDRGGYNTFNQFMLNLGSTPQPYEPYSPEVWHDTPHYIMGTSTDTLTTLPAVIYANDTTATVGLKGNMEQSSQPSPTTPIQPSECGERTGNLFDKDNAIVYTATLQDADRWSYLSNANSIRIPCFPNTEYTLSVSTELSVFRIAECSTDAIPASGAPVSVNRLYNGTGTSYTFTTSNTAKYIVFQGNSSLTQTWLSELMLNIGSTALPYEPWGVKIPISSANTTTPVYLGEVETTRKIKKLVLTGEENFTLSSQNPNVFFASNASLGIECVAYELICTHYTKSNTNRIADMVNNSAILSAGTFYIKDTAYETGTSFNAYLASEYSAGHPVTLYYVLAEPTTGIVNEPIRKIGDYADTVSGITIPTTTGKDTFDVLTTLKPSEVSLTYTGWHDATVKEWDGSEWQ